MVRRAVAALGAAPCDRVVVVVRSGERSAIASALDGLPAPRVELLVHPAPERGLGSSLALAARALAAGPPERLLVALVDQPLADARLFARLLSAAAAGAGVAACRYAADGPIGPPAVFSSAWLDRLGRLDGERGARELLDLELARGALALVDFPGGLVDVDTPEDYARLVAGEPASGGG